MHHLKVNEKGETVKDGNITEEDSVTNNKNKTRHPLIVITYMTHKTSYNL